MKKTNIPTVYVVLPVFNRLKFTKKCLSSLSSQKYKKIKVIVIDDGSTDNTSRYIQKKYPHFEVIKGDGNWWWTKSMHEGVTRAMQTAKPYDYILEMNNDCFFERNYISQLIKTAKKYPKSIIGSTCVLANRPSKIVEIGVRIDWPTGLVYAVATSVSDDIKYYKNMEVVEDIDALPGKGTLVPIQVFKKAGNFDYKRLPHYIADYEFTIRAKRHGYNLIVDTKAIVKHFWKATGLSSRNNKLTTLKTAWSLLFGRKSMNNIVDWFIFVTLCCPKEYLMRNYYFSLFKIAKAILRVRPFNLLKYPIRFLVICYHSLAYPKLAIYRIYLKIKQFPEYHLNKK